MSSNSTASGGDTRPAGLPGEPEKRIDPSWPINLHDGSRGNSETSQQDFDRLISETAVLGQDLHEARVEIIRLDSHIKYQADELERLRKLLLIRGLLLPRRAYKKVRRVGGKILRRLGLKKSAVEGAPESPSGPNGTRLGSYGHWVEEFGEPSPQRKQLLEQRFAQLGNLPSFSVVMPVFDPPPPFLRQAIESVRAQWYQNWELCIADDCSTNPEVHDILRQAQAEDPRIKVVFRQANGHISEATNSALELATGEFVALLDHDDLLAPHALSYVAQVVREESPDAGIIYFDEDKVDDDGNWIQPYFKPDFDPLLFLEQNYLVHCVIRRALIEEVGNFNVGYEGAQDWDLILRVVEQLDPAQIVHVPHVLYHWRYHQNSTASQIEAKPYAISAQERAVSEHLKRTGRSASLKRIEEIGHYQIRWDLPEDLPMVSIVIPTRDGKLLQKCLESLWEKTTYPKYEILLVDNGSEQEETLNFLKRNKHRLRVVRDERPFNYSALNNAAAKTAQGDYICLLNDDTEVISPDWLEEMVSQAMQPGVGVVGAKLYYSDGRVQHAGVLLGLGHHRGIAGHPFKTWGGSDPGYFGLARLARSMSAVTAACMIVHRSVWDECGGLDEALVIAFNDVDFCLRVRERGYRIVWTPFAELYHHESVSRGSDDEPETRLRFETESAFMRDRWGALLQKDPAYNPNLTLTNDIAAYGLAWPPRASFPKPLPTGVHSANPIGRGLGSGEEL